MRTPHRRRLSGRTGWALTIALGGGTLAVAAILPWTSVSVDGRTIAHTGVELGLGALTGMGGVAWIVIAAALRLVRRPSRALALVAIGAGLIAALAAVEALIVDGAAPDGRLDAALGLDLTVLGGATLVVAGAGIARSARSPVVVRARPRIIEV